MRADGRAGSPRDRCRDRPTWRGMKDTNRSRPHPPTGWQGCRRLYRRDMSGSSGSPFPAAGRFYDATRIPPRVQAETSNGFSREPVRHPSVNDLPGRSDARRAARVPSGSFGDPQQLALFGNEQSASNRRSVSPTSRRRVAIRFPERRVIYATTTTPAISGPWIRHEYSKRPGVLKTCGKVCPGCMHCDRPVLLLHCGLESNEPSLAVTLWAAVP